MASETKRGGRAYLANQFKQTAKVPCSLDEETRALLTRAACAVGIRIEEWVGDQANAILPDGGCYGWNPLASWGRGEAFAMAVRLRFGLIPLEGGGWDVERFDERGIGRTLASCANSGEWALQEAIVRAAAATLVPASPTATPKQE
jgi:hypothetical protein